MNPHHRTTLFLLTFSFCLFTFSFATSAPHPLDPLSADEIVQSVKLIRAGPKFPKRALFSTVVLAEPAKEEVLAYKPGDKIGRRAFAVVMDPDANRTYQAMVDITGKRLVSFIQVADAQPLVFLSEYEIVPLIVKADSRWQQAMRRRGIITFDSVQVDTWAAGEVPPQYKGRVLRALSYFKGRSINFYGQPIEGVVALVDMNTRKVVELIDNDPVPLPPPGQELDEESIGFLRVPPKPLAVTQPRGVGFQLDGNEVRWQGWRFRYSMHPREGLVLHTVGYEEGSRVRSILYRGSLSEMVVPYADTSLNWRWRSAFDVGEYGVGRLASPIEPKTDAPPNAVLIDAVFANDYGDPDTLERAVGIYERDGGLLWKHFDSYSLQNDSRRARELVIFFIATIGNYDYSVSWIFRQDMTLEVDAGLTGIMLPMGVADTSQVHEVPRLSGHLVAPNIVAIHHQHFFCFRLDMDVDGVANSVTELNSVQIPMGPNNPSGNAFAMVETPLRSEKEGARQMKMESARSWSIVNHAITSALGHHSAYMLVPGANTMPLAQKESSVRRRAGFIDNHFHATRYHADQIYAAGAYPNQSRTVEGLPRFIGDDERIEQQDLVVWYTMGTTHIPRPEEWPVMPTTHIGFKLIPAGFFLRNPALDVPR